MTSGALDKSFKPAWWLPGGHSQTLWRKFSPTDKVNQVRERIELPDGDFIDLDWAGDGDIGAEAGDTVVFILHGLCGCSGSPYVLSLQSLLGRHDIASVAMNFRGCSGEVNRLAKAYHSGISEDVHSVFTILTERYPDREFAFVGYSLGANVMLKWLAENKRHPKVRKAVAVSTPFSLACCSRAMLSGMSQIYGRYFVRRLVNELRRKRSHFESGGQREQYARLSDLGDPTGIRTIWEFDQRVTAPLHGFNGAEDYYNRSSSIGFLDAIDTDTLLIQSQNDPMIPRRALPAPESLPGNIELRLSPKGGHVGFIAGLNDKWLEHQILCFVQE